MDTYLTVSPKPECIQHIHPAEIHTYLLQKTWSRYSWQHYSSQPQAGNNTVVYEISAVTHGQKSHDWTLSWRRQESRAAGHNSTSASPGSDVEPKKPQKSAHYLIPLYEMQKHTNLICDDRSQAIGGQGSFGRAWVKSKRDSGRPAGYRCYEDVFAFKVHGLCT